jgi:hypothetical protein
MAKVELSSRRGTWCCLDDSFERVFDRTITFWKKSKQERYDFLIGAIHTSDNVLYHWYETGQGATHEALASGARAMSRSSHSMPATLLKRINGISTPFGGVQWAMPVEERAIVREFLIFLEDRRALYSPRCHAKVDDRVVQSVNAIREKATKALAALDDESSAVRPLRAIRMACKQYLDDRNEIFLTANTYNFDREKWSAALDRLQVTVGAHIAILALMHEIKLEPELATILPASNDESGVV